MARMRAFLQPRAPKSWSRAALTTLAYGAGWALVAVPVAYHGFMTDDRDTVIAGHDARVSPTRDGYATVNLGAYLPDVRYPTEGRTGVLIDLGKANVDNYQALIQRYALIASHPEGEVRKVERLVTDMALSNAVQGVAIGFVGPALWLIVGARRRRQLVAAISWRSAGIGVLVVSLVALAVTVEPWNAPHSPSNVEAASWQPIASLVPEASIPEQAQPLQMQGGLITTGTKRLVQSAFDTYRTSITFYDELVDTAEGLADLLRQPEEGEQVAILVSDRHDNVGMDQVTRVIADQGGASVLLNAGDDTSTGEPWEAFSLDSLDEAFEGYSDKYVVLGNHDEGPFVSGYFDDLGFTVLDGGVAETAGGIRILGAADPRSSGLGNWRDAVGISLEEQGILLADTACAADEGETRVSTLLVHDASLGREALSRGCVDLVLAGHLHSRVGPEEVTGDNGTTGSTYTTGTTGGAAYAFALGSKLRRDAMVTLITYRDGIPVGLQPVTIKTTGTYDVTPYIPLPAAAG